MKRDQNNSRIYFLQRQGPRAVSLVISQRMYRVNMHTYQHEGYQHAISTPINLSLHKSVVVKIHTHEDRN